MSGEAAARSDISSCRDGSSSWCEAVHAAGKPMVVVLVNGRPLAIAWLADNVPAILERWQGGTEAGNAVGRRAVRRRQSRRQAAR